MAKGALTVLLVVLGVALASRAAHAQEDIEAKQREARALHEQALEEFRLAHYDRAIEAFKAAYQLSPVPGLLYNIAETYRVKGKGSCGEALRFYQQYKEEESPAVAGGRKIDNRIAEMNRCQSEERGPAATAPVMLPADQSRATRASPRRRALAWTLVGVGAAAVVAGTVTGVIVLRRQDTLEEQCPDGGCPSSLRDEVAEYDRLKLWSTAGLAVGAVGVAAGLVVLWTGAGDRAASPVRRAQLRPSSAIGVAGIRGHF